jgi:putative redox protein
MAGYQTTLHWLKGISFDVHTRDHHQFMDVKREIGGHDRGPNPKETFLSALCGCSGMDVVSLLKKYKVTFDSFDVSAAAETTDGHPKVFTAVHMTYALKCVTEIDLALFIKAVDLSMTQYCGVSAMVSKACPIHYLLELNGEIIHRGEAHFS